MRRKENGSCGSVQCQEMFGKFWKIPLEWLSKVKFHILKCYINKVLLIWSSG